MRDWSNKAQFEAELRKNCSINDFKLRTRPNLDKRITTIRLGNLFFSEQNLPILNTILPFLPSTVVNLQLECTAATPRVGAASSTFHFGANFVRSMPKLMSRLNKSIQSVSFIDEPFYWDVGAQKFNVYPQLRNQFSVNQLTYFHNPSTLIGYPPLTRLNRDPFFALSQTEIKVTLDLIKKFGQDLLSNILPFYASIFSSPMCGEGAKNWIVLMNRFSSSVDRNQEKYKVMRTKEEAKTSVVPPYAKKGTLLLTWTPGGSAKLTRETQVDRETGFDEASQCEAIERMRAIATQMPESATQFQQTNAITKYDCAQQSESPSTVTRTTELTLSTLLQPEHWTPTYQPLALKIMAMYGYGCVLTSLDATKGQEVLELAHRLLEKVSLCQFQRQNMGTFKREFHTLLHSKDSEMATHREYWKIIVANIAVALTIIGVVPVLVKLAVTGKGFFQATRRERLLNEVDMTLSEMPQLG